MKLHPAALSALLLLLCLTLPAAPAFAQGDVFVGLAVVGLDLGTTEIAGGFTVAGSGEINDNLSIEGDYTYAKKSILIVDLTTSTFTAGPRFQSGGDGVRGFAHALVGMSRIELKVPLIPSQSSTDFAMILGGGVDFPMGKRAAWRVGFDYVPVFANSTVNNYRFVTGVVIRFGD